MADYSEEMQTALELIEEFGALFTFVSYSVVTTEPDKDWRVTDEISSEVNANAVYFTDNGVTTIYIETVTLNGVTLDETMKIIDGVGREWGFVKDKLSPLEPAGDGQIIIYTAEILPWPILSAQPTT